MFLLAPPISKKARPLPNKAPSKSDESLVPDTYVKVSGEEPVAKGKGKPNEDRRRKGDEKKNQLKEIRFALQSCSCKWSTAFYGR
jgi:hypothetical protein